MPKTVRVAILGGGMAGVAAAWTLANADDGVTYDITIYEASFRLGGKCASGRDLANGGRIDEHGIHILMGFYSQLLRILRDAYAELDPALKFPRFEDALEPADFLQLPDRIDGEWTFWSLQFPTNAEKPGDADPDTRDFLGAIRRAIDALIGWVERYEELASLATKHGAALRAAASGHGILSELVGLVELALAIRRMLANAPKLDALDVRVRHLWMAIYFAGANLIGIIEDRLFTKEAFQRSALNAQDYRDWLKSKAGELPSPELTWDSPIVRAIYDLVFSRAVGFAAGAALYDTLMMLLLYSGHVFYRMVGTGDVIFGPLYFALRKRGVRFRFDHVVRDVRVAKNADGSMSIDRIEIDGDDEERAVDELFVKIDGQPCWPQDPLFTSTPKPIVLGPKDFDFVVSAIPIGAIAASAPSLVKDLPVIARAAKGITTIPTQSIQLWLDRPLAQMGWTGGRMMLGSFDRPFNSAADMAQVLAHEKLPGEKAVMYMSDVYEGPTDDPTKALALVRQQAQSWVEKSLPTLLPTFTWDRLVDPKGGAGSARLDAQYLRANVTGTERYVASSPGTVDLRPPADGAGATNLLVASDWVQTEENAGCVEGAARSGVQAAKAISARMLADVDEAPPTGEPLYIQNDDDWAFPHPVVMNGASVQAFPMLAEASALEALCKRYSIDGVVVRPWSPIVPLVLVFAAACDDIRSTDAAYADWGSLRERELGVFVPVVVEKNGASFVAVLCPYLFVDNGAALVAGRETFGLPKELAKFPAWPLAGGTPMPLTATSLALQKRGDLATEQPIITIDAALGDALKAARGWNAEALLASLWKDLTGTGHDLEATLLVLKQFHAIEDGTAACYQVLARCPIVPRNIEASVDAGAWGVALPKYFFPDVAGTLGIASGAVTIVSVKATLDIELGLGEILAGDRA